MQKYSDVVLDKNGKGVAGLTITVKTYPAGLPATIYGADGGPAVDSVKTDAAGRFSFYAINGHYSVTVSGTGITPVDYNDIVVFDPNDEPASAIFTLDQFASQAEAIAACANKRMMVGAGEVVTINVPSQFSSIPAAYAAIGAWIIATTGTVKIQASDAAYSFTSSLVLNHPYGSRIQLLGNTTNPDNCTITGTNPPTFDLFVCSNGNAFGLLDGFKLDLPAKAGPSNNYTGVLAVNGATIVCGAHMKVNNWYYGIAARNGAMVVCPSAVVSNAGDVGIWAFAGSSIYAPNAVVSNSADSTNSLGFGIQAEYGSSVDCAGASVSGCLVGGIAALSNSQVRAISAIASNNTGSGFFARDGGTIECHGATANSNARYGVEVLADGHVYYNTITAIGNTINNFANRAYFDNGSLGARLVADDGPMRVDNSGANPIYFNTQGGLQLRIDHTASVANQWSITGSIAGVPLLMQARGTDANVAAQIGAKGNEGVHLVSYGQPALRAYNTVSNAANYIQVEGSAAGSAPFIKARGSDANVDLILNPKGTGVVQFGTLSANADAPITGYVTIKDAGGTLRKLAVIA